MSHSFKGVKSCVCSFQCRLIVSRRGAWKTSVYAALFIVQNVQKRTHEGPTSSSSFKCNICALLPSRHIVDVVAAVYFVFSRARI